MTYADRVHQCDTCDKKLEDNRRYGVERSRERALGEGT